MLKSTFTWLILLGVLAIIVGILALASPVATVLALVILFAVYAFIAAGLQAARAFSSVTAGPAFGHLLLGLIDVAAAVVAVLWPAPTALVLVLIVAIWAAVAGVTEIFAAFRTGETAGTRAIYVLAGLISVVFGMVLFASPGLGAVTLALLFGIFAIIYGACHIVTGVRLRRAGQAPNANRPSRWSPERESLES